MKVSFLTSSHFPKDDRIYYNQAMAITEFGDIAEIISSKLKYSGIEHNISFNSFDGEKLTRKRKLKKFVALLVNSKPDIVICSEPFTILAAYRYKKRMRSNTKIIYDITEWYPSKKNLIGLNFYSKFLKFLVLLSFNVLMSMHVDAFIFGEHYKAKPFRFLFPRKDYIYLGYYPDLKYISLDEPCIKNNYLRLSYSGKLSMEKGMGNFLNVIKHINMSYPGLNIHVKLIGWYANEKEKTIFENTIGQLPKNIHIRFYPFLPFKKYIQEINDTDIFIDLRSDDFENQYCLPIKLFYYLALKRPVIYTKLKAIRKEIDMGVIGLAVKPFDTQRVVGQIIEYIQNKELYHAHCSNARAFAKEKYNWSKIKDEFIQFLQVQSKK